MILYLDTTAFVKLFVREEFSPLVHAQMAMVDVVATSRVSYAEACDALARCRHDGHLSDDDVEHARDRLDQVWSQFAVIDINERAAADVTVRHGLRGYAALHIAAALDLRSQASAVPLVFCSFDERQVQVAEAEGLAVIPQAA
ncbi:MAG: type II toxin-antitoxin system VapC family toxin [Vicinamibacterales bacterium]